MNETLKLFQQKIALCNVQDFKINISIHRKPATKAIFIYRVEVLLKYGHEPFERRFVHANHQGINEAIIWLLEKEIIPMDEKRSKTILKEELTHQFVYDQISETYFSDFIFSSAGAHPAYFSVDYGNGQIDTVQFILHSLSLGKINGDDGVSIGGVRIELVDSNDSTVFVANYGESNPIITVPIIC